MLTAQRGKLPLREDTEVNWNVTLEKGLRPLGGPG